MTVRRPNSPKQVCTGRSEQRCRSDSDARLVQLRSLAQVLGVLSVPGFPFLGCCWLFVLAPVRPIWLPLLTQAEPDWDPQLCLMRWELHLSLPLAVRLLQVPE